MKEPLVLERVKREIDPDEWLPKGGQSKAGRLRGAEKEDCADFVDQPTIIRDPEAGAVKIVYLELDDDHEEIVNLLRRIHYPRDSRSSGMLSVSKVFGFEPRRVTRRDYCHGAKLGWEDPEANEKIMAYAERVGRYYEQYHSELYAEHQAMVAGVLPDYKLKNSVFTSGIINKNNPLPYHLDAGNFPNVWSNMLVFKRNCDGGHLSVPEYDACFELKDNSLLMFDGQNLVHGVTPFRRNSYRDKLYWRFSVVFYSLAGMWHCLPPHEELKRIQAKRTEREQKRPAPIPLDPEIAKKLEGRRR